MIINLIVAIRPSSNIRLVETKQSSTSSFASLTLNSSQFFNASVDIYTAAFNPTDRLRAYASCCRCCCVYMPQHSMAWTSFRCANKNANSFARVFAPSSVGPNRPELNWIAVQCGWWNARGQYVDSWLCAACSQFKSSHLRGYSLCLSSSVPHAFLFTGFWDFRKYFLRSVRKTAL